MLSLARFFRSAVVAVGLASLATVLAPEYTEPLWDWAGAVARAAGHGPLPSFGEARHGAALVLATFVVAGVGYNLWRDRRQRALRAECDFRTGATHLKEKVAGLQAELRRTAAERDKWQESYLSLTKKHTDALVAAKEHEVRSEYGRCDHDALGALRKEFDALVLAKGHLDGFREAVHFFLVSASEPGQGPEAAAVAAPNGAPKDRAGKDARAALPFALPRRA
jgi:hypothetical protein